MNGQMPRWSRKPAANAIATDRGWETPKGELLISHKGLRDRLNTIAGMQEYSVPDTERVSNETPAEETEAEPEIVLATETTPIASAEETAEAAFVEAAPKHKVEPKQTTKKKSILGK